mgnify:CR=1 FL=1
MYLDAKQKCYEESKDQLCLQSIESVVTHFPESKWAGESLVVFTDYYYRTKKIELAKEIVKILKSEYSSNKEIQNKIQIIERHIN